MGTAAFTDAIAAGEALPLAGAIAEAAEVAGGDPSGTTDPDRSGPGRPERLTRRELEVLRLVAAGHRDHEIADALAVSRRTVTTYVTSILNKLGVDSRTAAATYAVRHGLV